MPKRPAVPHPIKTPSLEAALKLHGNVASRLARACGVTPSLVNTWVKNGYIGGLSAIKVERGTQGRIRALDVLQDSMLAQRLKGREAGTRRSLGRVDVV